MCTSWYTKIKTAQSLNQAIKQQWKHILQRKSRLLVSCKMFVVYPETKLLQQVTFQVTSHEGSVIVSCTTSIKLSLIHTHINLDDLLEEGTLIYIIADMPKKQRNKNCQSENVNIQPVKPQMDVLLRKHIPLYKDKKYEYGDFKSQSTKVDKLLCSDKNCQEIKRPRKPKSVMQSVTNTEDVQLLKPAGLCSDKHCQSTRCYKNMSPRRQMYDK